MEVRDLPMPRSGRMTIGEHETGLKSLVANATAMAQEPWLWPAADLCRSQRILNAAGFKNIAEGLQSFIDEPSLPLGRRT